jgi:hypothetical protein
VKVLLDSRSAWEEGSHGPDPTAARPLLLRSRTAMKALMGLLIVTTLALGSGCASMPEQCADLLEIVMLFQELHCHAVP